MKINTAIPLLAAAVAGATSAYLFSPGLMSWDSFQQYRQVLGQIPLSNNFPLALVYLWKLIDPVFGASSILVLDQATYWGAALLLSVSLFRRWWERSFCLLVVGLWPPLYIISLHVWKDATMLAAMMMAVAAICAYRDSDKGRWVVIGGLSLLLASAVRYNALPGVIPVIAYLAYLVARRGFPAAKSAVVALVSVVGFCAVLGGLLALLNVGALKVNQLANIQIWDFAAVSVASDADVIPHYVQRYVPAPQVVTRLKKVYTDRVNTTIYSVVENKVPLAKNRQLTMDWVDLIKKHFGFYFIHRLQTFRYLLGLSKDVYYPYNGGIDPNNLGLALWHMPESLPWRQVFWFFSQTFVYRAYWYFCGALIAFCVSALIMAWNHRIVGKEGLIFALSASALGFILPLFIAAPAADFRYSIWMIAAVVLIVPILIAPRWTDEGRT